MTGRRTARGRAWRSVPIAVALLVPLAPTAAQAAPASEAATCRTVPLPVPAGTSRSAVTGGDPTGRYLVGTASLAETGVTTGLVWKHNRVTRIDASSVQHVSMYYNDVNRHGVVVGQRMTDYSSFHTDAFTYRAGRFTMLPPLSPGDATEAVAINSRGDVVGNSWNSDGQVRLVVWPAGRPGTVRALTMPDGQPAEALATDIDEDGTVVGTLRPRPPGTPYVWPATGTPHPLPVPEGGLGGETGAIRLGVVAGFAYQPVDAESQSVVPTVWNLRTGSTTTRSDVEDFRAVLSVNRWGTFGTVGAIVHADGRVVPVGSGASVEVITDQGDAAGTTDAFFGEAVRWVNC